MMLDISKYSNKALIWDLGNTLFEPDTFGIIREIGLQNFLMYSIFDLQNPTKIEDIVFKLLKTFESENRVLVETNKKIYTNNGKILPALMCDWLEGTKTGSEIYDQAKICLAQYDQKGFFLSKRQQKLVNKTLDIMFNPKTLAKFMKPIKQALNLLDQCTKQIDAKGEPKHKLFLLSNFDSESFNYLSNSPQGKAILQYFHPENIIISADVKMVKPYPTIYQYLIKKFNLNPQDCIFIDDQHENIETAIKLGMTGLHLEKNNYRKLQNQLKELHVF